MFLKMLKFYYKNEDEQKVYEWNSGEGRSVQVQIDPVYLMPC